jgi:UPF0716 family protein affecting phage T7 exclusion
MCQNATRLGGFTMSRLQAIILSMELSALVWVAAILGIAWLLS